VLLPILDKKHSADLLSESLPVGRQVYRIYYGPPGMFKLKSVELVGQGKQSAIYSYVFIKTVMSNNKTQMIWNNRKITINSVRSCRFTAEIQSQGLSVQVE